jgi:hypothetical protein
MWGTRRPVKSLLCEYHQAERVVALGWGYVEGRLLEFFHRKAKIRTFIGEIGPAVCVGRGADDIK